MSKFFKIDDDLVNLSRISNIFFKEEKFTISFKTPEKQFNKRCENQEEYEDLCELVSAHLDIIDLDEANKPEMATSSNITLSL